MPTWLSPVLLWGGAALAVLAAVALVYFLGVKVPMAEGEATAGEVAAPITLYWILLAIGVIGAVVGFFMRRPRTGNQ